MLSALNQRPELFTESLRALVTVPPVEFSAPKGLPGVSQEVRSLDRGVVEIHEPVRERQQWESPADGLRILVASRVPALAHGLAAWLSSPDRGWTVVGCCDDGQGLTETLRRRRPAVVVITDDCEIESIAYLAAEATPPIRLVAMTLRGDIKREVALIRLGVTAVVPAGAERDELVSAIEDVVRGRAVLSAAAVAAVTVASSDSTDLTPRQRDVLEHLALGRSTAQIAEALVVTPSTVKTHIKHIQDRLGVDGQRALVANARSLLTGD